MVLASFIIQGPTRDRNIIWLHAEKANMVVKTVEARCGVNRYRVIYTPSLTDSRDQIRSVAVNEIEVPINEISKMYGRESSFAVQNLDFGDCLRRAGRQVGVQINVDYFIAGKPKTEFRQFELVGLAVLRREKN